jgi:hypothetical protein
MLIAISIAFRLKFCGKRNLWANYTLILSIIDYHADLIFNASESELSFVVIQNDPIRCIARTISKKVRLATLSSKQ